MLLLCCTDRVLAKGDKGRKCCRSLNSGVTIVLVLGTPITRYLYTFPYMVTLFVNLAYTAAFRRCGPTTSRSKLVRATLDLPIGVLAVFLPNIFGLLGPLSLLHWRPAALRCPASAVALHGVSHSAPVDIKRTVVAQTELRKANIIYTCSYRYDHFTQTHHFLSVGTTAARL
jgi:hypothetical protein